MNTAIQNNLSELLELNPVLTNVKAIGSGHINTTWLLTNAAQQFIVQKLNTHVFKNPAQLVNNAKLIEHHLSAKQQANTYPLDIVKHISTKQGEYLITLNNTYYRVLNFINQSVSEDVVKEPKHAEQAAFAFGTFTCALLDFNASSLYPVITDFHNLAMRFKQLNTAISTADKSRLQQCKNDIDYCIAQQYLVKELAEVTADLPTRVCHNDTKINNMLFCSNTYKARAVIDLDTCMAGFLLYDFGDMVRTFCCAEAEDSTNLDKVVIRKEVFTALVKGYLAPLQSAISNKEQASLMLGAKVMPLMLSVRFLTDYLNNDVYFKTAHAEHNLERTQNQLALYKNILSNESWMHKTLMQ
ncbi:phosphotransferase [uncultured Pseudoalteromonas sp.]|uniref:phosphotransferase enzyme family protein n=1 Tax=uncultured Pseudoalteromonas sp. TaxID=114053 RepID=UPI0030C862EA